MGETPTKTPESTQNKTPESVQKKPRLGKKVLEKLKHFSNSLDNLFRNYGSHGEVSLEEDYHWNEIHGINSGGGNEEYPDYATPSGIRRLKYLEEHYDEIQQGKAEKRAKRKQKREEKRAKRKQKKDGSKKEIQE